MLDIVLLLLLCFVLFDLILVHLPFSFPLVDSSHRLGFTILNSQDFSRPQTPPHTFLPRSGKVPLKDSGAGEEKHLSAFSPKDYFHRNYWTIYEHLPFALSLPLSLYHNDD